MCVAQTKSVQELTIFKKSNFSLWTKLEQDVERRGGERKKEGEGTGENREELPLCFTGALWRQSPAQSFSLPSRPFFCACHATTPSLRGYTVIRAAKVAESSISALVWSRNCTTKLLGILSDISQPSGVFFWARDSRLHWSVPRSSLCTWLQAWLVSFAYAHAVVWLELPDRLLIGPKEWHTRRQLTHLRDYTSPQRKHSPSQCCAHQHHGFFAGIWVCHPACSRKRLRLTFPDLKDS